MKGDASTILMDQCHQTMFNEVHMSSKLKYNELLGKILELAGNYF